MYFSRRKLRAPRPPWPAVTWMSTSSTNMAGWRSRGCGWCAAHEPGARAQRVHERCWVVLTGKNCAGGGGVHELGLRGFGGCSGGDDADVTSACAVILELDAAVDFRKQRVVLAETHVESGRNFRPRWRTRIEPPVTTLPSNL